VVGLLVFFPVLYMFLTGFKTETAAVDLPPKLIFAPTLENYRAVFEINFLPFFRNSMLTSLVSTLFVMLLAIPCAYAWRCGGRRSGRTSCSSSSRPGFCRRPG
jgi:sorbitol/mannitol transport system permease protein